MIGHPSPTLEKPVYLSVNGLCDTTKIPKYHLKNQVKKVHIYYHAPLERGVNQPHPAKDAA